MRISEADMKSFIELLEELEMSRGPDRAIVLEKRNRKPDRAAMSIEELDECHRLFLLAQEGTTFKTFRDKFGQDFPKSIKDDLGASVAVVRSLLEDQRKYGTWPAPGYAQRVGIILRKAKRRELSRRFETAYSRHVVGGQ